MQESSVRTKVPIFFMVITQIIPWKMKLYHLVGDKYKNVDSGLYY
jgi:hypothetical protein